MIIPGTYGVAMDVYFTVEVVAATSSDRFLSAAVPWAAGDVKIDKDGAGVANVGTLPVRIGSTPIYKLSLTAAEMQATYITVYLVDADGPAWRDAVISIRTDTNPFVVHSGVAQAGANTSITLVAGASATNELYTNMLIRITGGTGVGQSRAITAYNGTTKVATVNRAWQTNPAAASTYIVMVGPDVWDMNEGAEPSATAAADSTFRVILQHLKRRFLNKVTQTASTQIVYADDAATAVSTMTCSYDGTTQTKGAAS